MRFLKNTDYEVQVRTEIRRLIDGFQPGDDESLPPARLLQAESAAVQQMRNYLADRYDVPAIFREDEAEPGEPDTRNLHIVLTAVDLVLYHLYSQTGARDVPEHRKNRYEDALDWLRSAGRGEIGADLPPRPDSPDIVADLRFWSRPPENHKW